MYSLAPKMAMLENGTVWFFDPSFMVPSFSQATDMYLCCWKISSNACENSFSRTTWWCLHQAASFQVFKPCAGLKCHLAIHICWGHLFGQGSVKKFSPPLKRKVLSSFKLYMFPNRKSQADLSRPMHLACMRDATNTRKTPNLHHTKLTPARC